MGQAQKQEQWEGSCDNPGAGGGLNCEIEVNSQMRGAQRWPERMFFMDGMGEVRLREESRMTARFSAMAMERREVAFTKQVSLEKEHM